MKNVPSHTISWSPLPDPRLLHRCINGIIRRLRIHNMVLWYLLAIRMAGMAWTDYIFRWHNTVNCRSFPIIITYKHPASTYSGTINNRNFTTMLELRLLRTGRRYQMYKITIPVVNIRVCNTRVSSPRFSPYSTTRFIHPQPPYLIRSPNQIQSRAHHENQNNQATLSGSGISRKTRKSRRWRISSLWKGLKVSFSSEDRIVRLSTIVRKRYVRKPWLHFIWKVTVLPTPEINTSF